MGVRNEPVEMGLPVGTVTLIKVDGEIFALLHAGGQEGMVKAALITAGRVLEKQADGAFKTET